MTAVDSECSIFTIGHSTRTFDEFVDLLHGAKVRRLVDVRSIPRSRTNPQYNIDALPETLAERQIAHTIIPKLGGRRGRQKNVSQDVNAFWKNQNFHNYADYAMSTEFQAGLDHLIALNREHCCAIMCSEAVWWRCHRRIIADYLLKQGHAVFHLMGAGRVEVARQTPAAVTDGKFLTYPLISEA